MLADQLRSLSSVSVAAKPPYTATPDETVKLLSAVTPGV